MQWVNYYPDRQAFVYEHDWKRLNSVSPEEHIFIQWTMYSYSRPAYFYVYDKNSSYVWENCLGRVELESVDQLFSLFGSLDSLCKKQTWIQFVVWEASHSLFMTILRLLKKDPETLKELVRQSASEEEFLALAALVD